MVVIIISMIAYLLGMAYGAIALDWYNKFGDSDFLISKAARYLGFYNSKKRQWNEHYNDIRKDNQIEVSYCLIWPLIVVGAIIKFIYVSTFKTYAEAQAKAKELKKLYVSTQDIYDFQEGDRITLKNGKEVTLGKFSLTNFADKTKTVFNWTDVKSNDSFQIRKQIQERDDKYLVFEKEADTFELKRKSFQDALSEQRKKIEEQYK